MISASPLVGSLVLTDEQNPRVDPVVERLVETARAGDARAFASLVERFEEKVLRTAWRLLGNREDALDAAQETFLRVHRYLGAYRSGSDFGGWLHRIAINVSRDLAAARGRHAVGTPVTGVSDDQHPEAVVQARQAGDQFARAVAALTEKERTVFVLRDLEDVPVDEIARTLGTSPVTVRVHLCSARRKLRDQIQGAER